MRILSRRIVDFGAELDEAIRRAEEELLGIGALMAPAPYHVVIRKIA